MTRETGIIMSGNHPKMILDGGKTQTRRTRGLNNINAYPENWTVDLQGDIATFRHKFTGADILRRCPYGGVGDRLGVRETHYKFGKWTPSEGKAGWTFKAMTTEVRYLDNPPDEVLSNKQRLVVGWFKRPSMFMFKRDIRIWREITEVRVERVQEITEADVKAEGIPSFTLAKGVLANKPPDPRWKFIELWDSLNAKRGYGWDKNPWAWCISFRRL